MKRIFKARNIISFCLTFLFFCVSIISTLFYNINQEKKQLAIINREYYGQSMQTFSVKPKDENSLPATVFDIKECLAEDDNCAIYSQDKKHIRQIYFQGLYNTPPLIAGRFFDSADFDSKENVAVVGKDRVNEIIKIDNKNYITCENKNFEVIGVAGTTKISVLDSTIFVAANKGLFAPTKVFALDINQPNADSTFENLKANLSSKQFLAEKMKSEKNTYEVLNQNDVGSNMMIIALICFAISILIISLV